VCVCVCVCVCVLVCALKGMQAHKRWSGRCWSAGVIRPRVNGRLINHLVRFGMRSPAPIFHFIGLSCVYRSQGGVLVRHALLRVPSMHQGSDLGGRCASVTNVIRPWRAHSGARTRVLFGR
jgi:hypothetical protein